MTEITVASFNAHWGMAYFGALAGQRFDVAEVIRGFDADVVVVPESWRTLEGCSILEPLTADGYFVETMHMARLHAARIPKRSWPGDGHWELAVCSRFPIGERRELPIGWVFRDVASPRSVLACTIDVAGTPLDLVAVHTSSRLQYLGPERHIRGLAPHMPANGRPAIVAGDFNFWGPGVMALTPKGWRRAVRGRTWPAVRPHSQIDHVLVNEHIQALGGEVLPLSHSDHRPVRTHLALLT